MKTAIIAEPKLTGREQELAELQRFLDLASEGKGSTVFISGEAGSGKTRLSKEFLNIVKNKEVTVMSGWCLSNSAIPYFPFVEAFESFESGNTNKSATFEGQQLQVKKWLMGPENAEFDSENRSRQTWKDQTFAAVTKELLFVSTQRPVVVFIDDIHWADSASLSLLQYLARAINNERILIIATLRKEERNTQLEGQNRPLEEILRIMRREDLYKAINLSNLTQSEVGKIAESMLNGSVKPELVEKLFAETYGNPLFVIESVKMLAENEGLIKTQNGWTSADEQFGIPLKVKDVILRRVNSLKDEERNVLDAGAVIGENFNGPLIGSILEQSTSKVLGILNQISRTNSLVCWEQDFFRFDHPKTREVLYEEISPPLRKHFHLMIAQKLETPQAGATGLPLGDIAYHYVQGGNKEKAIKYSLEAGRDALARFSNAEAVKHFKYVLDTVGEASNYTSERATALEGLGDAFYANMKFNEAIKTYKTLAAISRSTKLRALRKAMDSAFFQNATPELKMLLKEAEACDAKDPLENARILMNKARISSKEPTLAIKYFEEALKLAEEEYSVWDSAWVQIGLGATLAWTGQHERAVTALLRAGTMFRELEDKRWLIEAYNITASVFIGHLAFFEEGATFLSKAVKVNEEAKVDEYMRLAQINANYAKAISSTGDFKGALSKSLEALNYAEKTDSDWAKGMAYATLTIFYSILEDPKNAEEYLNKLLKLPEEVRQNSYVPTTLATALCLASKNQIDQAIQFFSKMLDGLKNIPPDGVEASVRTCYAWVLAKQNQIIQAQTQFQEAKKIQQNLKKRFDHINIQTIIMAPSKVTCDKTFETRIDIVNVSRARGTILKIENAIAKEFEITTNQQGYIIKNGTIEFNNNPIEPFETKTIKIALKTRKPGIYNFNPQTIYIDDQEETKTSTTSSLKINVIPAPGQFETEKTEKTSQAKIEFKSEAAQRIFNFLLTAFQEDYEKRRIPQERAGWRTLMDIVKQSEVSRYSVYGFPNSRGQAISELQQAGLAESRIFTGERGRGGSINKVRICYEKEKIKQILDKNG